MKKFLKVLLLTVTVLCLLTGCYKQDTTISVSQFGKIKVDITMLGNDDAISQASGGSSYEELMDNIMPQIENMKEKDTMTSEKFEEEINGVKYKGVRITADYDNFSEMNNSMYFQAFNGSVVVPVTDADMSDSKNGLSFRELNNLFGTTYTINGIVSVSQGDDLEEDELNKIKDSVVNVTFRFPFCSYSSDFKVFCPTYSLTVTKDHPTEEIHSWIFVPNIALLLAVLLLIVFLIRSLVLGKKIKKLTLPEATDGEADTDADLPLNEDDVNFFEGNFEGLDEEAKEIENNAEGFVEDVKEKAEDFAEEVKEGAESFVNDAKEEVENVVEEAKDAVEDFAGEVKEKAEDVFEKAEDKAEEIIEDIKKDIEE